MQSKLKGSVDLTKIQNKYCFIFMFLTNIILALSVSSDYMESFSISPLAWYGMRLGLVILYFSLFFYLQEAETEWCWHTSSFFVVSLLVFFVQFMVGIGVDAVIDKLTFDYLIFIIQFSLISGLFSLFIRNILIASFMGLFFLGGQVLIYVFVFSILAGGIA